MRRDDDSDDATCVPFFISQHAHGDVSGITSPQLHMRNHTLRKPDSASLFSRISKGISDALSPAALNFDSSTINAEDFLFEERSVNNWNIHQRNHNVSSGSHNLSFGSLSPDLRSQYVGHICESNHVEPSFEVPSKSFSYVDSKKQFPQNTEMLTGKIQRRAKDLRANTIPKSKSVSWVISPSTQSPTSSKMSPSNTMTLDPDVDPNNFLQALAGAPNSTHSGFDIWREVVDPESGRKYYYNRKTRTSKWYLPKGAKLMKKFSPQPTISYKKLTPHQSHTRDEELRIERSSNKIEPKSDQQTATHPLPRQESKPKSQGIDYFEEKQQSLSSRRREKFDAPGHYSNKDCDVDQSDAAGETGLTHSAFPQDWMPDDVFCLYCGLKCESAAIFGSHHLPQCDKFTYMQRHGLLANHIELERVLFRAWSKIGSSTANSSPEQADEDDVKVEATHNKPQNCGVDEKKICPFCDEVFAHGCEFSAHLLKCTVRMRMRKQRRSIIKKEGHSPPSRECMTPGRRMPWE
ncbi:hypothetical protein ACHAXA_008362 [Cyclostephanos tholiformis]|uniref:WW domain-containing protein n=1 Tax=Cyclostephanos tholiformis TaxID=382380 RepID=A0ABD3RW07_9STRA